MYKIKQTYSKITNLTNIIKSFFQTPIPVSNKKKFSLENFPKDVGDIYNFVNSNIPSEILQKEITTAIKNGKINKLKNLPEETGDINYFVKQKKESTSSQILLKGITTGIKLGHIGVIEHTQALYQKHVNENFKLSPSEWLEAYTNALRMPRGNFNNKETSLAQLRKKINSPQVQQYITNLENYKLTNLNSKNQDPTSIENIIHQQLENGLKISNHKLITLGTIHYETYLHFINKHHPELLETTKNKINETIKKYNPIELDILNNGLPDIKKDLTINDNIIYFLGIPVEIKNKLQNEKINISEDEQKAYKELNILERTEVNAYIIENLIPEHTIRQGILIKHTPSTQEINKQKPPIDTEQQMDINNWSICQLINQQIAKNPDLEGRLLKYNPTNLIITQEQGSEKIYIDQEDKLKEINPSLYENQELIEALKKDNNKKNG